MISRKDKMVITAYDKGYRVVLGKLYNPKGVLVKGSLSYDGYPIFKIRDGNSSVGVKMHRLLAYQKFGEKMFDKDLQVRHLNGVRTDLSDANIQLGTSSENMMDKEPEDRLKHSLHATKEVTKYNHSEVIKYRELGASYKDIMLKFGIKSKGTVSFIINKSYITK